MMQSPVWPPTSVSDRPSSRRRHLAGDLSAALNGSPGEQIIVPYTSAPIRAVTQVT